MWTKNFETLVNATAFVSCWLSHSSNYSSNIINNKGYHEQTPFSIKDTDGVIQNTSIGSTYVNSTFISGSHLKSQKIAGTDYYTIDGVTLKNWYVRGLLSDGEIGVNGYMNVCFGSGTAPESREDYTVDCISGITSASSTMQAMAILNEQNNNYDLTISSAIQCPNACTITEIGIHRLMHKYNNSTANPSSAANDEWCNVLLYRKKLDTPIVLQPNEPATVTFQISLPRITLA